MSIKRWKLGWKRCDCVKCEAALTIEQTEENCGWVRWEDHKEEVARLKAEVERLTVAADWKTPARKIQALEAEVERLRKAGDDLEFLVCFNHQGNIKADKHSMQILDAWLAAKEGKQP